MTAAIAFGRAHRRRAATVAATSLCAALSAACGPTSVRCEDVLTCSPVGVVDAGGREIPEAAVRVPGSEGGADRPNVLDASESPLEASNGDVPGALREGGSDGGEPTVSDASSPVIDVEVGPSCDVERAVQPGCVAGVFVAPVTSGAIGTATGRRSAPFRTIAEGMAAAAGANGVVFVCDDGIGYNEPLVVGAAVDGLRVDGGYACGSWTRSADARAQVHPPTGTVLAVQGLMRGLRLESFVLLAADAPAGASSIAVSVNASANVVLAGVRIVAGRGGEGAPGVDGSKGEDAAGVSIAQAGGRATCPATESANVGGSWSSVSACGSQGGSGGTASPGVDGTPGTAGVPRMHVHPLDAVNNRGSEGPVGGEGARGGDGDNGANGAPSAARSVFTSSGYTPAAAGGIGSEGWVAQGGGGGGASNATGVCIGASGGAGGMGGCGGKPGSGGASGGASVALLSFAASVTLDGCELLSAVGGPGGKGGAGGAGGLGKAGAAGGAGVTAAEGTGVVIGGGGRGGAGGNGGPGGAGAGGNGGPSYVVVYQGLAPIVRNGTTRVSGLGGAGGPGGLVPGGVQAADGSSGPTALDLALTTP